MPKKRTSFRSWQLEQLARPERAASYLQTALEESPEQFLIALGKVAQARQMSRVAAESGVQRESLYRCLSGQGNPTLSTLTSVLKAVGLRLSIVENRSEHHEHEHHEESDQGLNIFGVEEPVLNRAAELTTIQGSFWSHKPVEFTGKVATAGSNRSVEIRTQPIGPLGVAVPFFNQPSLSIQPTRPRGEKGGYH